MAYNLESLIKILQQILQPDRSHRWILDPTKKPEIKSLLEKALFLKQCFGNISPLTSYEIESLESRVRDASHEAEDILESNLADQIYLNGEGEGFMISPQGLQGVIAEFDSAVGDIKKITDDGTQSLNYTLQAVSPMVDPYPKEILVGIDQDSIQLKDRLTGPESKLVIIPIVGMGGIGKTTLAQSVYEDPLVISHFHTRAWVAISQHKHNDENNLRRILLGLQEEMLTDEILEQENEQLGEHLYKNLIGRRYLVVLDDMWVTDDWDDLRRFFPDDKNGSRVMVTTRETDVANYASSDSFHHQMQLLDEDESWNLLRQKVFAQEPCPPELEKIGRRVANSCKGLPLAVHVIGGVIAQGKRTQKSWGKVAKDVNSIVADNDEQFPKILSLSYNHLPNYLKPCFLYMGAFSEDAKLRRSRLIRLWVAEGFLKPIPDKSLEEAGDLYLKNLVDRNLISVRQKETNGIVKSYSMHDLLRDLCVKKASQERFIHVLNGRMSKLQKGTVCLRRVIDDSSCYDSDVCLAMTHSRSFLLTGYRSSHEILAVVFQLRLLKVLDILEIKLGTFPDEMLQLINLRYLAFGCYSHLSSSISSLRNLETIIFEYTGAILALQLDPFISSRVMTAVLNMPRLQHFRIKRAFYICKFRDGNSFLVNESLQTLSGVVSNQDFVKLLKSFPSLNKLGLLRWNLPSSSNDIDLSSLLKLESFKCRSPRSFLHLKSHPSFFIFPPSLKKLALILCEIYPQHLNVVGNLPNLQVLKLRQCNFVIPKWEPVEGEFSRLQFLLLEKSNLENWAAEETNFPRLERLAVRYCSRLEGIPISIGDIPTLEIIELHRCRRPAMDSARKIQEEQLELGNYGLQVRITR